MQRGDLTLLKALIVDDEKTTRHVLENFIPWAQLGITGLMTSEDGLHAVQTASEFKPDIVLCDIRMPRMNGIVMAENIREFLPDCRFIFLSAYTDKEYFKSAIRLRAISYVEKPLMIDEIVSALNKACEEIKLERKKNVIGNFNTRQKLCLDLISTPANSNANKDILIPEFELPIDNPYIATVLYYNHKNAETNIIDTELKNKMNNMIIENNKNLSDRILMSFKGDRHFVILFKLDHLCDQAFINNFINNILGDINKLFSNHYDVYAGIGCVVKGRENICKSYRTALTAMKNCFFSGSPQIYSGNENSAYIFDKQLLAALSHHLKNGKFDNAVLCVKRLGNEIQKHSTTSVHDVKSVFTNILLVLFRFSEDHNLSVMKNNYTSALNQINGANFLKDIINSIVTIIEAMAQELSEHSIFGDPILKISEFVNKNYFDTELSIYSISKYVFLTPIYISLIFKQKNGKIINQNITEVRMENAKNLLNTTDSKITEIANNVGYNDPKYFAKVFRKIVGIKPSEYRERHGYEKASG